VPYDPEGSHYNDLENSVSYCCGQIPNLEHQYSNQFRIWSFDIWNLFVIWILEFGFRGCGEESGGAATIFLLLMGD
jgi:hypothetical protein